MPKEGLYIEQSIKPGACIQACNYNVFVCYLFNMIGLIVGVGTFVLVNSGRLSNEHPRTAHTTYSHDWGVSCPLMSAYLNASKKDTNISGL